jgi:uncharacterized protein DUF2760
MHHPDSGRRFLILAIALIISISAIFDLVLFAVSAAVGAAGSPTAVLPGWIPPDIAALVYTRFWTVVVPGSAVLCLMASLILRQAHRRALTRAHRKETGRKKAVPRTRAPLADTPPVRDPVAVKNRERRIFVHLLALMQREGRLFDFFTEDLADYEDAQIGAAVRSIHQSCGRVIRTKLSPQPLMDASEGETVTVTPGFDPGTMTLTGNVVGEPPFTGVVRHRG